MLTKIQIQGKMIVKTGLHIGGGEAFAAIGAVDSTVVKDPVSCNPMIPGTSLKGKLRTLLAKTYNENAARKPDEDCELLLRIFGSAKPGNVRRSRIQISDMFLENERALKNKGLQGVTEVKFENTINRMTAVANPRQIERIVRGAEFGLDIVYNIEEAEKPERMEEAVEDIKVLAEGLKLLQYDYLGGSGSRGYGKVEFSDLCAKVVVGKLDESQVNKYNDILTQINIGSDQ